ncbi:cellulose biosynthesis protein BcsS [Ancylobacter amanitiformis]|uniref:Cellulose biosynthesis protein BcsS n=1 Tax=Ancylobacter amanitiformis TaxID=217069 RepID=A0ABU0LKT9_9HYPH|nr:cellulose biosynthesis protein BcsS [Ancylobacter amanitiformis]MDQ0509304.1 hypothetical protein [Ancylobacter amanitiformis]
MPGWPTPCRACPFARALGRRSCTPHPLPRPRVLRRARIVASGWPTRLLAALLAAGLGIPAAAQEGDAETAPFSLRNRLYFFTGVDIARDNAYGWGGAAWAPFAAMDQEGLRLRGQIGGGHYSYRTDAVPGGWNGVNKQEGEVLAGWQWLRGPHALALYVGANVIDNQLDQPDPSNPDQGVAVGAKFTAEWFYRHDENWTFTAALSGSTADDTGHARATAARRVNEWYELGVEAGASTDWLSQDARGGLFITTTSLPGWQVRAAGGWRWSSDSDDSPYATMSLFLPY